MNIGFTGSRHGMSEQQKVAFTAMIKQAALTDHVNFHYGMCIGSDDQAAHIVNAIIGTNRDHRDIYGHPPINQKFYAPYPDCDYIAEPAEYLIRNRHIVDACDFLIVCPYGIVEKHRSGTWSTVRYARKQKRPIVFIWPDGSIEDKEYAKPFN